ncbi:MAG: MFS transporter, partial [Simkaniaceae bacterium]|nr:MFS transporter [Simkaniaceae bacterium]
MVISEKKRKQLILLAMTSSTSLIFLNATLLPVALPTIQKELLVSMGGLQWIINAYLLATAVFVIAGGRLGDLFGHRKIFCIGVVIYSVASA